MEGSELRTEFNITLSISTGIALQEVVCPSHKTDILCDALDQLFENVGIA